MIDKNLILYLPFDDPDGEKAYDYSQSRADAILSEGASFSRDAQQGKSLALNGIGECVTSKSIPLSSSFTLTMYVKPSHIKLGWIISLPGIDQYLEQWLDVVPGEWIFLAFVKAGKAFTVYLNHNKVYTGVMDEQPVGFSLNDPNLDGCTALIDEVKLYNVEKTAKEIFQMQKESDVEYYIDGRNFKEFGVYVSESAGLVGRLARKEALQVEWDSYHGTVRDKKRPRYKERTIELDCFIEASSRSAYVEWVNLFFSQFDKEGNHRLKVEYSGTTKPLVYEVELLDDADPQKQWGKYDRDLMVGKFKIKLVEDEPVKKVLRHIGTTANTTAQINVTSSKLLNIYWGDGTHTYNVSGTDKEVTHTYTEAGEYDIVITGVIEDITSLSTNAIVVWDLLK
jgi:hypothetical protein